ncbi:MAG: helix-turn-helix transcriptional regulator [Alphaproteobacteria bacterium]|nr:helix-turn-helix transcriptional regulator [Alphaproteobacteria bacterium]
MLTSSREFGAEVRRLRKAAGMTQRDLAAVAGVGERFIVELEDGKPRCQLEKSLRVMKMLAKGLLIVPRPGSPP